jgi:hypothetical protein
MSGYDGLFRSTTTAVRDDDAEWTLGVSSTGSIELIISSAKNGHRCTLALGYIQATELRDRLATILSVCKPKPSENG